MTTRAQEVLQLALQLEPGELAQLTELLNSVKASQEDEPDKPEDWDEAWSEELSRRDQDGPEHWVDGEEALKQIFGKPS